MKALCYSTETYLRYYVKGENSGQNLHERSTSRIGPIPTKLIFFAMYDTMRFKSKSWSGTHHWYSLKVNIFFCTSRYYRSYLEATLFSLI